MEEPTGMIIASTDYVDAYVDAKISEIQNILDEDYTKNEHTHTKANITDFPTIMPPTEHEHTTSEITDFPTVVSKTASGLCPTLPDETTTTKYLRQDGSWTEPDTKYTFIIDSDEKLLDWANDTPDNDYSRILIKENKNDKTRGWALTSTLSGGNSSNPLPVIDISNGRTKSVVGESGSKIVINNSQSSTYLIGIKGNVIGTYPNFTKLGKEYFFRNVNIEVNCTGTDSFGYGFNSCTHLSNCTGTGTSGTSGTSGYCYGYGFYTCTNLSNCTGSGIGNGGYGFHSCTNLSNCTGTGTHGFRDCTNLSNCTGTGDGYGFYSCRTGFGNKGSYIGNGTGAGVSFMHPTASTDQWGLSCDRQDLI